MSGASKVPELLDTLLTYTTDENEQIPDGYRGEKNEDGQKNGFGTMIHSYKIEVRREIYVGFWREDQKHGQGVMHWTNGDKYEGNWYEDQKSGKGCMKYKNGDTYSGFWRDNQKQGDGLMKFNDGNEYIGTWTEDKMATGTFKNENQDWSFYGEFIRDCPTFGTLTDTSGNIYSNSWQNVSVFVSKPTPVQQNSGTDRTEPLQFTLTRQKQQKTISDRLKDFYKSLFTEIKECNKIVTQFELEEKEHQRRKKQLIERGNEANHYIGV